MKKLICTLFLSVMAITMFAQAKKPTIMVIPSDGWCNQQGFLEKYDNQGTTEMIPNYNQALLDMQLRSVISKLNILMADRGFPLVDLEASMKNIRTMSAENNLLTNKKQGAALAESPLDKMRRTAKADIIMEIEWTVNTTGPRRSITYNLRGLDAYTLKQIAGAQGTGQPSLATELPVLMEEAVLVHMDEFTNQLQNHFDDLFANGREVTVDVLVFDDGSGLDLEKEFDGYELTEIIDDWMAENTVNHRFNRADATETFIYYQQVRIPMFRPNGMAMDTRYFVGELRRFLGKAPYNVQTKIVDRGLGRTALIIGDK